MHTRSPRRKTWPDNNNTRGGGGGGEGRSALRLRPAVFLLSVTTFHWPLLRPLVRLNGLVRPKLLGSNTSSIPMCLAVSVPPGPGGYYKQCDCSSSMQ
jgi:hypothetical protein